MAAVLRPQPVEPVRFPSGSPRPAGSRSHLTLIPGGAGREAPRVYLRRRIVAATLLVVTLALVWAAVGAVIDRARAAGEPRSAPIDGPVVVVEARSGDTVWSIARRVRPDGDVRVVVDAILAERGTAALDVGEAVRVPAA